jgi:hypothetical protein
MGWAERKGQQYFYRSIRDENGRVKKVYLGRGPDAEEAAAEIEQRRQARLAETNARRTAEERYAAAVGPLEELCQITDLLARATLAKAGYHQHARGAWRRRMKTNEPIQAIPSGTIDLREVLERANNGDASVMPLLDQAFDDNPALATKLGNLARSAEMELTCLIVGKSFAAAEAVDRYVDEMRARLRAEGVSAIDPYLVDRVVCCWLAVHEAELAVAAQLETKQHASPVTQAALKRLDRAHARYLATVRTLATVRKLLRPARSPLELLAGAPVEGPAKPKKNTGPTASRLVRPGADLLAEVTRAAPVAN